MADAKEYTRVYVVMWADLDRSGWTNEETIDSLLNAGPVFKTLVEAQRDVLQAVNNELNDLGEPGFNTIDWKEEQYAMSWLDDDGEEAGVMVQTWSTRVETLAVRVQISAMPLFN